MNDDLPPVPNSSGGGAGAAEADAGDLWPTAGPAKGLRVRLPVAIACAAVVALAGAAAGAALKKPAAATSVQAGGIGGNRALGNNGAAGANGAAGPNAAGRFGGPGGGVFGTVTKVEGNTITVTQRDGTTATVVVPSGTAVTKTVSGSPSDLTAGTSIAVRGTTADGKTTAESVTINPANGAAGFGPGPGGSGAPPAQTGGTTTGN